MSEKQLGNISKIKQLKQNDNEESIACISLVLKRRSFMIPLTATI